MDNTPAGRPRLEGRRDKPGHPHHKDEPQNYKGNNADSARVLAQARQEAPEASCTSRTAGQTEGQAFRSRLRVVAFCRHDRVFRIRSCLVPRQAMFVPGLAWLTAK